MLRIALVAVLGCGSREGRRSSLRDGGSGVTDERTAEEVAQALQEFACSGGLSVFEVCPCDVEVDWSRLTEDMFGEAVQPARFQNLGFARTTSVSVDEVLDAACDGDSLDAASTDGYVDVRIWGATSASLSEMSFLGTPADPPALGRTYWLFWSDYLDFNVGTRMAALVSVVEDGTDSIEIVWP